MITEDYVSFETAKFLKEKGFAEECRSFYTNSVGIGAERHLNDRESNFNNGVYPVYSCPTLQMAMKWLREVHNITICICAYYPTDPYELHHRNNKPYWKIRIMNHTCLRDYDSFNTYEEACEVAIKYCLENLILKL